jgi:hypothetical protein
MRTFEGTPAWDQQFMTPIGVGTPRRTTACRPLATTARSVIALELCDSLARMCGNINYISIRFPDEGRDVRHFNNLRNQRDQQSLPLKQNWRTL